MNSRSIVVIGFAALLGTSGMATAQDFGTGTWYMKGFGGLTFPSGQETELDGSDGPPQNLKFDFDSGFIAGISAGYYFTPNVALEVEYSYRNADASTDVISRCCGDSFETNSKDVTSNAIMFNALYVFDAMGADGKVRPYLGGGIGGSNVSINAADSNWDADSLLAYQLMGGVGYQVSSQWSVFGEGRWFTTQDDEFGGPGRQSFDSAFETFDLLFGATYSF